MNENIDLTKILDGCPKGTKFYSPIFGEIVLRGIIEESIYPIRTNQANFISDGRYLRNFNGECMLFPAKDQRDWAKFERFWDKPKVEKFDVNTLQPFDKVLVRYGSNLTWQTGLFGYRYGKCIYSNGIPYCQCIPYNDEIKHLLGTTKDCPDYYKWWEE